MLAALKYTLKLSLEVLVEKSVDERVDDVVDKVHVKYDDIHLHNRRGHEPSWQKSSDKDDSNDKERAGCLDIGHAHALNASVGERTLSDDRRPAGSVVV